MTLTRLVLIAHLAAAAVACGGGGSSPTAPSPAAAPAPTASAPAPAPAPAPASLTGTWGQGSTASFTLTQNGSAVTGTLAAVRLDVGFTMIYEGTVTGTTTGGSFSLVFNVTLRESTGLLTCRGSDTYVGQISGNTLTGILTPAATAYVCDGGIPLTTPTVGGTTVYTRQ